MVQLFGGNGLDPLSLRILNRLIKHQDIDFTEMMQRMVDDRFTEGLLP